MALVLTEAAEKKLLEVKTSGKLSKEDYERFERVVSGLIKSFGNIKLLFVMHDFQGWNMRAVWEDIKFATRHRRDIEKIAMVGDNAWETWMATLRKPPFTPIKYFDAGEEELAREWLLS